MQGTALEAREVARMDELDDAARWRFENFVGMGFSVQQAEKMATTRGDDGFYLHPGTVHDWLKAHPSCPIDIAFDLLT